VGFLFFSLSRQNCSKRSLLKNKCCTLVPRVSTVDKYHPNPFWPMNLVFPVFCFSETKVAQAGFEFTIVLPHSPNFLDYRCAAPCLALVFLNRIIYKWVPLVSYKCSSPHFLYPFSWTYWLHGCALLNPCLPTCPSLLQASHLAILWPQWDFCSLVSPLSC
jgi:hypothetical protein